MEEGEGLPVGENDKEVVPVLETVPLTLSVAVGLKLKEGLGDLERVGVGEGGEGVGVREKVGVGEVLSVGVGEVLRLGLFL